jgi:hypothetical protein
MTAFSWLAESRHNGGTPILKRFDAPVNEKFDRRRK